MTCSSTELRWIPSRGSIGRVWAPSAPESILGHDQTSDLETIDFEADELSRPQWTRIWDPTQSRSTYHPFGTVWEMVLVRSWKVAARSPSSGLLTDDDVRDPYLEPGPIRTCQNAASFAGEFRDVSVHPDCDPEKANPLLFLSQGKHHSYLREGRDEGVYVGEEHCYNYSYYTDWICTDDVDGHGADSRLAITTHHATCGNRPVEGDCPVNLLEGSVCGHSQSLPNNVGEFTPTAVAYSQSDRKANHDPDYFVNDLFTDLANCHPNPGSPSRQEWQDHADTTLVWKEGVWFFGGVDEVGHTFSKLQRAFGMVKEGSSK